MAAVVKPSVLVLVDVLVMKPSCILSAVAGWPLIL